MRTMERTRLGRIVTLGFVAVLGACGDVSPAGTGSGGRGGAGGTTGAAGAAGTTGVAGAAGTTGVAGAARYDGRRGRGGYDGRRGRHGRRRGCGARRNERLDRRRGRGRRRRTRWLGRRDRCRRRWRRRRGTRRLGWGAPGPRAQADAAAARAARRVRAAARSCALIDCVVGRDVLQRRVREHGERSVQLRRLQQALRGQHAVLRQRHVRAGAVHGAHLCVAQGASLLRQHVLRRRAAVLPGPGAGLAARRRATRRRPTSPPAHRAARRCASAIATRRRTSRPPTPARCSTRSASCRSPPGATPREPVDVRHLGPMAQDFRASFGLGDDDQDVQRHRRARRRAGRDPGAGEARRASRGSASSGWNAKIAGCDPGDSPRAR